MKLERQRRTVVRATFHIYELAALVAAARYVAEAAPPDMPAESVSSLRELLADYDTQMANLPPLGTT